MDKEVTLYNAKSACCEFLEWTFENTDPLLIPSKLPFSLYDSLYVMKRGPFKLLDAGQLYDIYETTR